MLIILEHLLELEDVSRVKLAFLTGPDTLKKGYTTAITTGDGDEEPYKEIFNTGIHRLRKPYSDKLVHKFDYNGYVYHNRDDLVPDTVPYSSSRGSNNNNNNNTTTMPTMITKKLRIEKEMNTSHWTTTVKQTKNIPSGMCIDQLYMDAQKHQQ
jgi:hypothetical protein